MVIQMAPPDAYPLDPAAAVSAREIADAWRRERPQTPVDSIPIVTPLWRVAKLLADDRRRLLAESGIDPATVDLLSTLRRSGNPYELSTRELARRSLVTAGAISQRVAKAQREGLVERTRPGGRDRLVMVTLTDKGRQQVDAIVDKILFREIELLDGLTGAQREELTGLLSTWLADLQQRLT